MLGLGPKSGETGDVRSLQPRKRGSFCLGRATEGSREEVTWEQSIEGRALMRSAKTKQKASRVEQTARAKRQSGGGAPGGREG